jgi:hypothetical protein
VTFPLNRGVVKDVASDRSQSWKQHLNNTPRVFTSSASLCKTFSKRPLS